MKKVFVLLAAAVMAVAMPGMASADFFTDYMTSPSRSWTDYGSFSALPSSPYWGVDSSSTPNAATLDPRLKLAIGSGQTYEFGSLRTFNSNQSFAITLPFNFTSLYLPNQTSESVLHFGLGIHPVTQDGFFVVWGSLPGITRMTGFLADADPQQGQSPVITLTNSHPSDVTSGILGLVYDAASKNLYLGVNIDEGENAWQGWHTVNTISTGWLANVQLQFGVTSGVEGSDGSFVVSLDNTIQNNLQTDPAPVPIPPTFALLAPGLLAIVVGRRRFTR